MLAFCYQKWHIWGPPWSYRPINLPVLCNPFSPNCAHSSAYTSQWPKWATKDTRAVKNFFASTPLPHPLFTYRHLYLITLRIFSLINFYSHHLHYFWYLLCLTFCDLRNYEHLPKHLLLPVQENNAHHLNVSYRNKRSPMFFLLQCPTIQLLKRAFRLPRVSHNWHEAILSESRLLTSEQVGWIPIVRSKSSFLAPIRIAMA